MRSILITGVSSGIGAAAAARFLKAGWRVIGTVRRPQDGSALEGIAAGAFHKLTLDIIDEAGVERLRNEIPGILDGAPLDVVCNNAGTSIPAATAGQSVAAFRAAIELNLIGHFAVTRACLPLLRRPGGRIIFIGSLAGIHALPFAAAYSAAKHGVEALASSLRVELAETGIRTIVVAPGSVRTAIGEKIGRDAPIEGADGEFGPMFRRMGEFMSRQAGRALPADSIASVIEKAASVKIPKARYVATPDRLRYWLLPRMLSPSGRDWIWKRRLSE